MQRRKLIISPPPHPPPPSSVTAAAPSRWVQMFAEGTRVFCDCSTKVKTQNPPPPATCPHPLCLSPISQSAEENHWPFADELKEALCYFKIHRFAVCGRKSGATSLAGGGALLSYCWNNTRVSISHHCGTTTHSFAPISAHADAPPT